MSSPTKTTVKCPSLDPVCPRCDGERGEPGAPDEDDGAFAVCSHCNGSGKDTEENLAGRQALINGLWVSSHRGAENIPSTERLSLEEEAIWLETLGLRGLEIESKMCQAAILLCGVNPENLELP